MGRFAHATGVDACVDRCGACCSCDRRDGELTGYPENGLVHAANLVAVAIAWVIVRRVPSLPWARRWHGAAPACPLVDQRRARRVLVLG